jgi:hypothetical protein
MKIRSERVAREAEAPRRGRRRSAVRAGALGLLLLAWGAMAFVAGISFFDYLRPAIQNLSGATTSRHAMAALLAAPGNYLGALMRPAPVEEVALDIKFKHLHRLHQKREEALRQRVLLAQDDDEVPATVTHAGRTVPVSLRLKGDWADHFASDKWSFRIRVKNGDHLFGMRRLSLQAPETRGFHTEIFFQQHLRDEGVLGLRYFFVDLTVDGSHIGLMAVEEHFGKELLESQERREGVIVRFDESTMWENVVSAGAFGPFDDYHNASIKAFGSGKIERSPKLAAEREVAIGLLRAFVEGTLAASQVFDVELMARFLAVAEIWRVNHGLHWHNLRYYLNPLTSRLEPVGFDGNLQTHYVGPGLVTQAQEQDFIPRILEDPEIRGAFVSALRRISNEALEGDLIARMQEIERTQLAILHREYPMRARFDFDPMRERAERLRAVDLENLPLYAPNMVDAKRPYAAALHAWLASDAQGTTLELSNALPVPVSVVSLGFAPAEGAPELTRIAGVDLPLALPPLRSGSNASRVRLRFESGNGAIAGLGVEGVARVHGQERPYAFRAQSYLPALDRPALPRAELDEVLAQHPFLSHLEDANQLRAAPGTHAVKGSLVVPEGMGLALGPGTTLRFEAGEGILATGPLAFEGREDAPIVLAGPESTNPAEMWAGVVVLASPSPSRWTWVEVRGTAGSSHAGWSVTAGVVFRQAPVTLEHCRFVGNRTEDALNIVRSRFELREVEILDTSSDAFDGDFTEGTIEGGTIAEVGGDGIDVSGSQVTARGVQLRQIRDKAISVGEGSTLVAEAMDIRDVGVAFAAKDRSRGELRDSTIDGITHAALMAYVKKPEYGPAELEARDNRITGVARLAVAQTGSRVVVDGEVIPESDVDIDRLYREGPMKK